MTIAEVVALVSALTVLVGGYVTARTSVRKSEIDGFQTQLHELREDLDRKDKDNDGLRDRLGAAEARLTQAERRAADAESRLAQAERRATDADERAARFRSDVAKLGERLTRERKEHQANINKLVIIIEKLWEQLKDATGKEPDIDLEALRQMVVIDKG